MLHIDGRDLTVILLSLLLAFSIWLIHNLSLDYSDWVDIPVIAESNIEGHDKFSSSPNTIMIRCRTSGFNLLRLKHSFRKSPKVVFFDKDDFYHLSDDEFAISADVLNKYVSDIYGDGVLFESSYLQDVVFHFPEVNHKKVPVKVNHNFLFKSQYMPTAPLVIRPDSVMIYGEPYHIDNIDYVETELISKANIKSRLQGMANLEKIKGIRLSEDAIKYDLSVSRYVDIERDMDVYVHNKPANVELFLYPTKVPVIFHCKYPVGSDPISDMEFYIDYKDFQNSLNGNCLLKVSHIPYGVISYVAHSQIIECVENVR